MGYDPKTWKCGETITANKLNHIEQGISDNSDAIETLGENISDTDEQVSALKTSLANEATERSAQDAYLDGRINNIVAPSGTAPNPDEIIDARYGADGVQYNNLGNAIRDQFTDLRADLTVVSDLVLSLGLSVVDGELNITYTEE